MFKWFKKHCKKLIIASSIFSACICGLFGFTKSFAYELDNSGHLVGNNLNVFTNSAISNYSTSSSSNLFYTKIDDNTFNVNFNNFTNSSLNVIIECPSFLINSYFDVMINYVILIDSSNLSSTNSNSLNVGILSNNSFSSATNFLTSINNSYNVNNGTTCCFAFPYKYSYTGTGATYFGYKLKGSISSSNTLNGYLTIKLFAFVNINKDYFISNNQTFYPYSSIEQLEQEYNTLLQRYNDYVASHSYTNSQYNDLVSSNTLLQQQLSNLQLQYDVYVASHSHTNEEYNNLLSGYEDLLDIHRDLENEYDDLQQRYDALYSAYDDIYNKKNHGYFNFLDYIEFSNGDYSSGHKTLYDLINDNIIDRLFLDVNSAFIQYVEHQIYSNYIDIYFVAETVPLELFEMDFNEFSNAQINIEFYNAVLNQTRSVSLILSTGRNIINGYTILRTLWGDSFTQQQYEEYISNAPATLYITYIQVYGDFSTSGEIYDTSIDSGLAVDGESYQFGYDQGYAIATRSANNIKAENSSLKGTISTLENNNNQLQHDYNNLNSTYQNLRKSYNDLLAGRNDLSTLFFTIAQTPFETFKTIWNVDFLGVNLAGFFTGIIMLGLMLWIVKKIF